MSKKRNKKKPNPVYQRGIKTGISKTSKKVVYSIGEFEKMRGVGPKTMKMLYEAFGIRMDIPEEEEKELERKWGRYK